MVVLVVLALFNIGLVYYLRKELKNREEWLIKELSGIESYLVSHDLAIKEKIKNIPKEITIKNVLKLP